jgi:hypothetical protein
MLCAKSLCLAMMLAGMLNCFLDAAIAQPNGTPSIESAPVGSSCPWKPTERPQAAPTECGHNDLGMPNMGIFDCGVISSGTKCVEHCVFKRCHNP